MASQSIFASYDPSLSIIFQSSFRDIKQIPVDVVVFGAQLGTGVANFSGCLGKTRRDVLHLQFAKYRIRHLDDRLARLEMRIGEHFRRPVDQRARNAVIVQDLLKCFAFDGHRSVGDQAVKLAHVLAVRAVGRIPLVFGEFRPAHWRRQVA